MRRLNVALLAGIQLTVARSPGFSIHDDLLAFPQFEVVFAEQSISEKDAQALVEASNEHPTYSAGFSQTSTITEVDAAAASSPSSDEVANYSYEIVNMSPHRYLCSIPVVQPPGPVNETENALAIAEEKREHRRAAAKGWELVNELENSCLYYVSGWWSYSFCNNREILQYHAIASPGNGQAPRRDPNSQEYILGQVPTLPAATGGKRRKSQNDEAARLPAELQIKGDQRYLVQRLGGGTVCDLTGKERTIEVQYQCVPGMKYDKIGWIKEVVTCAYVMMINTPRLCDDVAFRPPVEKPANPISCRLIFYPDDASRPLLDQHISDSQTEDRQVPERRGENEEDPDKTQPEPAQVTVGGVIVGGKRVLSSQSDNGKPVKLAQLFDLVNPQPKVVELIATAASKANGGKVKQLTEEELERLNIDPKALEEMREKLKKLAGDNGWKVEMVQMNEGDEKELLGYVNDEEDTDGDFSDDEEGMREDHKEDEDKNSKKDDESAKGRKGKENKKEEGSQEDFYYREEL